MKAWHRPPIFSAPLASAFLLPVLAAVGLPLLLAGCLPATPPGKDLTTLRLTISGQPRQLAVEQQLIAEFERRNPDIRIDPIVLSGDARTKLQAMIAGHAAPDVFSMTVDDYPSLAQAGALLDLEPFMARDPLDLADMYDLPKRVFLHDGRHYALGLQSNGLVLFYNADFFRAAGLAEPDANWTWDDFLRASGQLVRYRAGSPDRVETYGTLNPDSRLPFLACGGRLVDDPHRPGQPAIESAPGRAGLDLVARIARDPGTMPPEVGGNGTSVSQRFVSGKVAMFFDGRWRTPDLAGMKYRWNVVPVPRGADGRHVTTYGGTGVGISSQSTHPAAAWRLVRFYLSPDGQRLAAQGGRVVPVYRSLVESREFLDLMPGVNMRVFADTMGPGAAENLCYTTVGPQLVGEFFNGVLDVQLGVRTPEQAAADIAASVRRDLGIYRQNHPELAQQ